MRKVGSESQQPPTIKKKTKRWKRSGSRNQARTYSCSGGSGGATRNRDTGRKEGGAEENFNGRKQSSWDARIVLGEFSKRLHLSRIAFVSCMLQDAGSETETNRKTEKRMCIFEGRPHETPPKRAHPEAWYL